MVGKTVDGLAKQPNRLEFAVNLKLMVLDVAGTTVLDGDDSVARCVCDALAAVGVKHELAAVDPLMGMPKPLAIACLLESGRGTAPDSEEIHAVHADFRRRMIDCYRTSRAIGPMPGVERLFATLRERGTRIALDTGFDRPILDVIIDRLDWRNVIDDSITSDEVPNGRPHPDMIHALMERAGVADPLLVGKVGDSVSDLEEGLNAGCGLVVAVLGQRTEPQMHRFPTVRGIRNLDELTQLLTQPALAGAA